MLPINVTHVTSYYRNSIKFYMLHGCHDAADAIRWAHGIMSKFNIEHSVVPQVLPIAILHRVNMYDDSFCIVEADELSTIHLSTGSQLIIDFLDRCLMPDPT